MTRLALFVLACFWTGPLLAQPQRVPPVAGNIARLVPPSPQPQGFIADVPGVVPVAALASLNARIKEIQAAGLGDIGVAILPSIGDFQPYEVGLAIYREWRVGSVAAIGSARRDVGVLLLIVPKELAPDQKGQCWVSTGTGAEGIITDAVSGRICTDRIIPHLRNRDYGAALAAGVEAIAERLRNDTGLAAAALPAESAASVPAEAIPFAETAKTGVRWWHILGGMLLAAGGMPLFLRWKRHRPRRCPKCGQRMRRLSEQLDDEALDPGQRMEERFRSVDYDVWSCSCGESLVLPYKALLTTYKECPSCHRRTAKVGRVVTVQPTYTARGEARDTTTCKHCKATSIKHVSLPKLTPPSTSSSGSSSSSSSSSSGSSFGGSGSSSGGGGGSSY
jgi:uncharacterized protein